MRLATWRSDSSSARDQFTELDGSKIGISMVLNKLIRWVMVSHCRWLGPFASRRGTRTATDSPPPTAIKLSADQSRLSVLVGQKGTSMRTALISEDFCRVPNCSAVPNIEVVGEMKAGVCWTRRALPTCNASLQDLMDRPVDTPWASLLALDPTCVVMSDVDVELFDGRICMSAKREQFRTGCLPKPHFHTLRRCDRNRRGLSHADVDCGTHQQSLEGEIPAIATRWFSPSY